MEQNEAKAHHRFEGITESDAANYGLHMFNSLSSSMKRQLQYFKPVIPWLISSRTLLTFILDRHEPSTQTESTAAGHYQLFKAPYPGQPDFDIVLVGLYKLLKSDNVFVVVDSYPSSARQTSRVSTTEASFSASCLSSSKRSAALHSGLDTKPQRKTCPTDRSTS